MTALELIAQLRDRGIRIRAVDGELELDAPPGSVDVKLREQLVAQKPDLLRLLSWSRRSSRAASVPLEAVGRDRPLPLSWAQQRLWFLDQLEPGSSAYNISWTVRLRGNLRPDALAAALDALVARQESLRTVFPAEDGIPRQVVIPDLRIAVEAEDVSELAEERFRARLQELAAEQFDLATGPLVRVRLLRQAADEHILLVVIHHIVSDGASMRVLFRELAGLYEAELAGTAADLPALPVQYADFAVWQREWLDSEELERQSAYWKRQLEGLPPLLELPWDRPRAAAMRYRGASVLRVLPDGLANQLRALGRAQGATLFMTMLAAFQVLLMRYSGRDDPVVGTPMGGRSRTQLEGLIGFFINTVVLRADLSGAPTFNAFLRRMRDVALDAHAHQDLPFEKLVEELKPERELSYSPVFQVMFDLQEEPRWKLPVRNLEVVPEVVFSSRTSSFDLTLSIRQAENGLDAMFEYDTDLFDESTIERMASHYQTLLESVVLDPEQPVTQLALVEPAEQRALVHRWNTAAAEYPADQTIVSLFAGQARLHPERCALDANGAQLSYAEFDRRSNRLAHTLRALGVGADVPVALSARRRPESFIAFLAILKAGGCVVPLDPAYPAARLEAMLEDSGARLLLLHADDPTWATRLGRSAPETMLLDDALFTRGSGAATECLAHPDSLACIMYTSGSTGRPKGVELPHRGFVNYLCQLGRQTGITPADRILQFASLSFDIAIEEMLGAWLHGAALVLRDRTMNQSLEEFAAGCARRGITWMSLPTAWWHELCGGLERGEIELPDTLRTVVIGGEKAELEALRKWRRAAGRTRLFNTYGPTEASIVAAWYELTDYDTEAGGDIPLGYPVPNVRVWVMDEHLQPVPAGVPGEVYIGGVGIARGYRNATPENRARFFEHEFVDGTRQRLYRTGDRARYLADGRLAFMGRADAQLKIRGHRVEPADIEAAIARLPGVSRCAVIAVDDEATVRLIAYVCGAGLEPRLAGLRGELAQFLPEYMLPSAFVLLDQLPFTENGKLDRRALPVPVAGPTDHASFAPPRGETETALAAIWADVLGFETVGRDDDFFALGGHSLVATRVMARVRAQLHSTVALRALFDHPTVAGLARVIDAGARNAGEGSIPRRSADARLPPLSWAQQRLWLLDKIEPGNSAYNLYSATEVSGPLSIAALQSAVDVLVERHELLRTRFVEHEGRGVQLIEPRLSVPVDCEEMHDCGPDAVNERLRALVARPFDLAAGPLLRVHCLHIAAEKAVVLVVLHHIVSDGWSMGRFYGELATAYRAHRQGHTPDLPPLDLQYADYATWQHRELERGALERQAEYWVRQLEDAPPLLQLPLDRERPPNQTFNGAWVSRVLDPALLESLRARAAERGCTLFMVTLAAFNALLARETGRRDLLVGTPVAGRTRPELEPLIGCFLNTLVLRTRLEGDPSFEAVLGEVRGTTLSAYEHQELPFEQLLERLQPARSTAYTPLVQVLFNLHNEQSGRLLLAGAETRPLALDRGAAKFDLSVALAETAHGLRVGFEYNSDLFDGATVERWIARFEILLRALAEDPARRIGEIELAPPYVPPRVPGSAPVFDADDHPGIAARFARVAERHAARIAVRTADHEWTYLELRERASAVARSLRLAPEFEAGASVGLLLGHDAPMVAAVLGVLEAGASYVPLDTQAPPARQRAILEDAGCRLLLADPEFAGPAGRVASELGLRLLVTGDERVPPGEVAPVAPAARAYVLFTSGSTGRPKGVCQSHGNVLHQIATYAAALNISPDDRLSLYAGYGFDAAVMDFFGALLTGATLCPVDLGKASDRLMPEGLTVLHATPTVFRFLVQGEAVPKSVRLVVLGGEAARKDDFELYRRHCPDTALFVNGYGPSESTLAAQFVANKQTRIEGRAVPIGTAVRHCELRLLDASGASTGLSGEIAIRSRYVSPGYLNLPELTAQKFLPDPDRPGTVLYRTGDLARRLPDGNLVFEGRRDAVMKVRGLRIDPGDIESVATAVPGVRQCAVLLQDERIVAFYRAEPGVTDAELRDAFERHLPRWMHPGVLVRVEKLPLRPNGKVDSDALRDLAVPLLPASEHVPARTESERFLAHLWGELLGVESETIGIEDDFFRLGGHSLLAMRVAARLRERYGTAPGLREFFAEPTIAGLAGRLGEGAGAAPELPLGPRAEPDAPAPLSWAQERLWFLDQLEPDSAAYNLHWAARIRGRVDPGRLQSALQSVARRHASLRTSFTSHGGVPLQLVAADADVRLQTEELPGASDERIHRRLLEFVRRPFDLARAPLFRAHLLLIAPDEAVLLFVMHHIVTDGWSMDVLFRDLGACYATPGERPEGLPELTVQYPDFASWQRAWLTGERLVAQESYWAEQLGDAPPLLELPLDHPRPPVQRYRGAWETGRLDAAAARAVKAVATESGATVFMVLLAAFKVLLMRYSGREDILVGTPVAGRRLPALENLVGFFLNTLVLRTQVGSGLSFRALLERVRATTLGAYDHQDLPFEKLLELLRPARSTAHTPLVQVTFNLHNEPGDGLRLDALEVESFRLDRGTSKFDLSAVAVEGKDGLAIGFEYNTDLFEPETVRLMLRNFEELLQHLCADPERAVASVPLSTRYRPPRPDKPFARFEPGDVEGTIPGRFARIAAAFPDRDAVSANGIRLSYAELDRRAHAIAWLLHEHGARAGDRVGLLLGHNTDMPAALLGTLRAGCTYVPLDPHAPEARLRKWVADARLCAVLADGQNRGLLEELAAEDCVGEQGTAWLHTDLAGSGTEPFSDPGIAPDSLAYILFTSGSTGTPKGVMQTHRNVLHHIRVYTNALHLSHDDQLTLFSAFGFDAAVMDIFGALLNGACLLPMDLRAEEYPGELLDRVALDGVTVLHATPTVFRYLMRSKVCRHDLGGVRAVVLGGEEVQRNDFDLFCKQFAPPTLFVNGLGPSESTTALQFFADHDTHMPGGVVPVGSAVEETVIRVLDDQGGEAGIEGELAISSAFVSAGYWQQPELTVSRFATDPLDPSRTLYRTGDRVRRLPDGQLVFVGRIDNQLKVLGNRVEPGEIEAELLKCDGVERAAVVLRKDGNTGRLVAYLVGEFDARALRRRLRAQLPDHMVPSAYVQMDDLPLTANGKLDRAALPAPSRVRDEPDEGWTAPTTEAEIRMARLWEDVLGVERIGLHDDFFELGGHSLLAAQLASRVMETMQVAVPIRRIFDAPTVAGLSEHVETLQWALNPDGTD